MKIVFLEPLGLAVDAVERACDGLKKQGHEVVVYPDRKPEKNIERAAGADIVVESNMPLRKDFLDACPNLKMLSIAFTGLDHIDMEECQRRGIVVKNAAGYSTEAVAEETICMMIGLYRHVIENDRSTRSCKGPSIAPGREIAGKTVGIIGMGAIGQRTAALAQAFVIQSNVQRHNVRFFEQCFLVDKCDSSHLLRRTVPRYYLAAKCLR